MALKGEGTIMRTSAAVLAITLMAIGLPTIAVAQERLGDGVLGALAGALVGGPVGAVVGGGIGYTAGPRIAHGFRGGSHGRPRRHAFRYRGHGR